MASFSLTPVSVNVETSPKQISVTVDAHDATPVSLEGVEHRLLDRLPSC
jgi:calcineurin-like phosphoesterase family protein